MSVQSGNCSSIKSKSTVRFQMYLYKVLGGSIYDKTSYFINFFMNFICFICKSKINISLILYVNICDVV